nr:MAG TPA: hypothetical protein [Caudoviricetes sp.]
MVYIIVREVLTDLSYLIYKLSLWKVNQTFILLNRL